MVKLAAMYGGKLVVLLPQVGRKVKKFAYVGGTAEQSTFARQWRARAAVDRWWLTATLLARLDCYEIVLEEATNRTTSSAGSYL